MKKSLLICLLLAVGCAQAATYTQWVEGVSVGGGWSDFNKSDPDVADGDNNLCWAAAASNVINWWQNRYETPVEAPQGKEIWNTFKNSVSGDVSGSNACAFQWWLTGQYNRDNSNGQYAYWSSSSMSILNNTINGKPGFEGFYRDLESTIPPNEGNYYRWHYELSRFVTFVETNTGTLPDSLGVTVVEALRGGAAATISLSNFKNEGHAITLWGVEYNDSYDLTGLWLTDSDDLQYGLNPEGLFYVALQEQTVTVTLTPTTGGASYQEDRTYLTFAGLESGDWYWKSDTFNNDTLFINRIEFFNTSVSDAWGLQRIPEPATATLGLLALAGLAARRRRH